MSRYIDADKLHNEVDTFCRNIRNEKIHRSGIHSIIENAPTADVVEVKHGKWINEKTDVGYFFAEYCYECSVCGSSTGFGTYPKSRYCPYCGAKMDGETE